MVRQVQLEPNKTEQVKFLKSTQINLKKEVFQFFQIILKEQLFLSSLICSSG
jgi:hypothetical protein